MEHTKIVECYPFRCFNRAELIAVGANTNNCSLRFDGTLFTRTVYRPTTGPDVLIAQSKGVSTYECYRYIPIGAAASRFALYNAILELDPRDVRVSAHPEWNLEWSWGNVAECVSECVEKKGIFQREQPEVFFVTAEEAFGTLSIMRESPTGWIHIDPLPPIDEIPECIICTDSMNDNDSIQLPCRHVFHRKCFFPALWEDPDLKCWLCQRNIF